MPKTERSRLEAAVSTISTVSEGPEIDTPGDSPPAPDADLPARKTASAPTTAPATAHTAAATASEAPAAAAAETRRARTLTIPIPTAVVGALVAGMFGLLFFSLNGLRADIASTNGRIDSLRSDMTSEIGSLRSDMTSEIGSLRSDMNQRFSEVDQRFAEIHGILLGHSDRLARIETRLEIEPRITTTAADEAAAQQHTP